MSCYYDAFQHPIGSIVTRSGYDLWLVLRSNARPGEAAEMFKARCIKPTDGIFQCRQGDVEWFMADDLKQAELKPSQ